MSMCHFDMVNVPLRQYQSATFILYNYLIGHQAFGQSDHQQTNTIMLFFKKVKRKVKDAANKASEKWYPSVITVGKPAGTQEIAQRLARESTLSPADVHAVIRGLPTVMAEIMAEGRSINLEGLGSFRYTSISSGNGVEAESEVNASQINAIRVRFTPAREKQGINYTRSLVGNLSFTEWRGVDKKAEGGEEERPGEL